MKDMYKHIIFMLILVVLTVGVRFYFVDYNVPFSEELQNNKGEYYYAQYDSYYYADNANSLWVNKLLNLGVIIGAMLLLYCIIYLYTKHIPISFIGALLYSLFVPVVLNTFYGTFDNDISVIFMSILIFTYLLINTHDLKKNIIFLSLILVCLLFDNFNIFLNITYMLLVFLLAQAVYSFWEGKKEKALVYASLLMVTLLVGFVVLKDYIFAEVNGLSIINELQQPHTTLSLIFFLLIFVCYSLYMIIYMEYKLILLGSFYLFTLIMTLFGWRHVILFAIPLMIVISLGLKYFINATFKKQLNKNIVYGSIILFVVIIGFSVRVPATIVIKMQDPIVELIPNLEHNYTIISWWDYGHIYQHLTNNTVMFKGSPINDDQIKTLADIYICQNITYVLERLNALNNNEPFYLLFNSNDLKKIKVIENLSTCKYNNQSMVVRGLTLQDVPNCRKGAYTIICYWT